MTQFVGRSDRVDSYCATTDPDSTTERPATVEITFTDANERRSMSGKLKLLIVLLVIATVAYVLTSSSDPVEISVEE